MRLSRLIVFFSLFPFLLVRWLGIFELFSARLGYLDQGLQPVIPLHQMASSQVASDTVRHMGDLALTWYFLHTFPANNGKPTIIRTYH